MHHSLIAALRVILRPNSAFAEIRDNDERYFVWSIGVYILGTILLAVITAPLNNPALESWEAVALSAVVAIPAGIIFPAVIYLVGRRLGGNASWRKVFSVVFYAHVYIVPPFVVLLA